MLVKTYNTNGEEIGQTRLPSEIFDVKINSDLIHQVVISQMANKRTVIAHTKDRAQVRGGGKKPWRQKGTGRARHGSRRSPLWKGGGVTFGPTKERNFEKKINKKMKRKAILMVLSAKVKNNLLLILEKLSLEKPKTKLMAGFLGKLPFKGSALIVLPHLERDIVRSARNIKHVATVEARNLNALDLLSFKYLIMPKDAIKVIKETFI
jgi:large subunit ribosomal protein L4